MTDKKTDTETGAAAEAEPAATAAQRAPAGEESADLCQCAKTTAATVAGASFGVIGGVAAVAAAAVFEVLLPAALCLWAAGLAGGAIGLMMGIDSKEKTKETGKEHKAQ